MSGRGKSRRSLDLIDAAARILHEIKPASIRAVCYRLFVEGLIPSMDKTHTNTVSRHLVWAREQGRVSWEWIVDENREAERVQTWNDPKEIIRAAVRGYRKDYWSTQPEHVEVWSEKGTVRGTLAPVLNKYGITFRVMHGYGSATALHDIAEETENNDKLLTVIYVGDWDPSGLHMSEIDLPRRIERYNGIANINRIAIGNCDVGRRTELPSFKAATKTKDPRHTWYVENYGIRCWELDALSPVTLRERVEAEILSLLDTDAWNRSVEVETAEIESMTNFFKGWPGISMPRPQIVMANVTPITATHIEIAVPTHPLLEEAAS